MTDPGHLAREEIYGALYRLTGNVGDPRSAVHDPLAALRVLMALRAAVSGAERDAIRRAREDGTTWAEIGAAMSLPAVAAFGRFASDFGRGPAFPWKCQSCGAPVSDGGPEMPLSDAERGHAEGCERFAATLAAWDEQWRDE